MSELTLKPGGEPGVWFISAPDPLHPQYPFVMRLEGVTDETLSAIEETIDEYLLAKLPITAEDFEAVRDTRRRKVIGWWCLAAVWTVAIGIVGYVWGKGWN